MLPVFCCALAAALAVGTIAPPRATATRMGALADGFQQYMNSGTNRFVPQGSADNICYANLSRAVSAPQGSDRSFDAYDTPGHFPGRSEHAYGLRDPSVTGSGSLTNPTQQKLCRCPAREKVSFPFCSSWLR